MAPDLQWQPNHCGDRLYGVVPQVSGPGTSVSAALPAGCASPAARDPTAGAEPGVLLSAIRLSDGGPGRLSGNFYHVVSLVKALVRVPGIRLAVLADEDTYDELASVVGPGRTLRRELRGNTLRRDFAIASAVYQLRPDVFHKPTGALPTIPLPCRTIAGIADLNFLALPTRLDKRLYKEATHRWTSRMADHIVCVSEFTRQTVLEHLRPDPSRVSVIHHGASAFDGCDTTLADDLALRCGSYWLAFAHHAHKNVETLLHAVARQKSRVAAPLALAVVGDALYVADVLKPLAARLAVEDRVTFVGRVSARTLCGLYRGSEGLLFPSLYEGFGLPVLEAMANGCPVVCSNVCSLPEIAGDAAVLIAPTAEDAVLAAIDSIRSGARDELVRRGYERARQFTWDRAAQQTVSLYRRLVATDSRPCPVN